MILNLFNSTAFGLSLSPSWYNILYQVLFIANIIGNIKTYRSNGSLITFNIYFFIIFILIIIFTTLIIHFIWSFIKK